MPGFDKVENVDHDLSRPVHGLDTLPLIGDPALATYVGIPALGPQAAQVALPVNSTFIDPSALPDPTLDGSPTFQDMSLAQTFNQLLRNSHPGWTVEDICLLIRTCDNWTYTDERSGVD